MNRYQAYTILMLLTVLAFSMLVTASGSGAGGDSFGSLPFTGL